MNNNGHNNSNDIFSHSDHRVNQDSFSEKHNDSNYKKQRKILSKTVAVACVLVVLVGTVATISFSQTFGKKDNTVANAETSAAPSDTQTVSVAPPEPSVPPEPEKPVYSFDNEFENNFDKLSKDTITELNETVTAEFVLLYDATTDEVLYQKKGTKKCYPASTTKLLTAIVSSAIIDKDTVITVGDEIELIGEESSTAGLQTGDKLTFEMLMDALMLPSGNDAAYTIAVNAAKIYKDDDTLSNEEAVSIFMELVNDAAEQLNATDTHFTTPDGWHDDDHYTTAKDLAKIAAYARTIPIIKNSVSKAYAEWEFLSGGTAVWYNSNQLLLGDSEMYSPYVDGMKTGFTDEAGSSVVASATVNGHTLIAVVMNGETLYKKYEDANLLFKAGFALYDLDYIYGYDYYNEE